MSHIVRFRPAHTSDCRFLARQGSLRLVTLVPAYSAPDISFCKDALLTIKLWSASCDAILGDFIHTLHVLHVMYRMRIGHYKANPTSRGAGICAVPMADAVATGEINCCNFIVRHRSLPQFAGTISQQHLA